MEEQNRLVTIVAGTLLLLIAGMLILFPGGRVFVVPLFFILTFILCLVKIEIVLSLVFVAILFSPEIELFQLGSFSKPVYVRLEDLAILVSFLGLIGNRAIRKMPIFKKNPLNIPVLSFIFIYILATLRGILVGAVDTLPSVFIVIKIIEFFMFYFIGLGFLEEKKQCRMVISAFFVIGFMILLFYLPQVLFKEQMGYEVGLTITSPFEGRKEPTTTGGILILIMSMALSMLVYEKNKGVRLLYVLMIVLAVIPFFATLSRTSYLAAFVAFVFFAIVTRKIWLIVILPLLGGLAPIVLPATVWTRIAYTWSYKWPGAMFDQSTMERITIWKKVWPHFIRSPFVGYGANYLNIIDSNYARILAETGIIGLGIFIWIFVRLYRMGFTLYREEEGWIKGFALGYLLIATALLTHGLASITFFIVRIVEFFWILTAVLVFLYINRKSSSS
jgi:putative inorganic carbon (hco3(-)) transporter